MVWLVTCPKLCILQVLVRENVCREHKHLERASRATAKNHPWAPTTLGCLGAPHSRVASIQGWFLADPSFFRNFEKGPFAPGAVAQSCHNCVPNLRLSVGFSFRTAPEGYADLLRMCHKFASTFRTVLCKYKYPFSNAPASSIFFVQICLV